MQGESLVKKRALKVDRAWEGLQEQPLGHLCPTSDVGGWSPVEAVRCKEALAMSRTRSRA
jgi:hypothetical protein